MGSLYYLLLSILILTYCSSVQAQIALSEIPVASCAGNVISGTATYTTDMILPTDESQRIPAGDFWDQEGAVWEFSTDTPGVKFVGLGIPGAGAPEDDIPQADINALKIGDSSTVWTLSVPTPSVGQYDIVFAVTTLSASTPVSSSVGTATSGTASITTPPGTTSTAGTASTASIKSAPSASVPPSTDGIPSLTTTNTAVAKRWRHRSFVAPLPLPINPKRRTLHGAKFRRASQAATAVPAGQYHLIIKGTYPCADEPGLGLQPPPSQSGTSDPALVTACSQNSILPSSAVWSAYDANSYLSSILSAAAPAPTDPQVDAGTILSNDIGESTECNYNTYCAPIVCKDVRNNGFGDELLAQRFLAYTAYINFSNFFYEMWNALFNAATLGIGSIDDITTVFFTDPTPDATWEQILGLLTPLLTILASAIAPFLAGTSLLVTALGAVVGETIAGGNIADLAPVIDQRFSEAGKISAFVTSYLKSVSAGIQTGYQNFIGNASADQWCGSPYGDPNGIFGSGFWVDSNHMSNFQTDLYSNFVKTLAFKSINYAWNDSNAFIIYVPYGVKIKLTSGDFGEANQTYCETLQTSAQEKVLTVCDGMNGMARIFNANQANAGNDLMSTTPMGWNANYQILSGERLDTSAAIRGSVASWAAGDFNYDVADQWSDEMTSGNLDEATATAIGTLDIAESTAGFFNIPVCRVFDLASFPPASPQAYPCACAYASATGGTKDSTKEFSQYVTSKIMNLVSPPPIYVPESPDTYSVCGVQQYNGSG